MYYQHIARDMAKQSEKMKSLPKSKDTQDSDFIIAKPEKTSNNELCLFACEVVFFENVCQRRRNLHTLIIIGQYGITSLNGISNLIQLRELWIVECLLKDISELQSCNSKLEKLYLYSNDIDHIPNLSNCPEIILLNLSGNNISQLRNLHNMPKLREFYLANNKIRMIGDAFRDNSSLSTVNMAGNPLYQLTDIQTLGFSSKLRSVAFTDPLYGECPLTSLCNYRYFVIYHLSDLTELDHYSISTEERSCALDFFKLCQYYNFSISANKMMFYNMLWHKNLDLSTKSLKNHLKQRSKLISECRERIYAAKLEQVGARAQNIGTKSPELSSLSTLQQIYSRIEADDISDRQWRDTAKISLKISQRQLSLTMQHCGNIKFIEYLPDSGPGNSVVKICQNMCNNSLCTTVKRDLAIKGVHICRVVEIVNNETDALRSHRSFNEFSAMHKAVVSETEMIFRLLVKPVGVVEFKNWPFDIFEKEFFDKTEVIISGCLAAADADWAHKIFSKQLFPSKRACSFSEHRLAILVQMPLFMLTVKVKEDDVYHAMHSDYDKDICACLSIKNPEHVKPVFAVEFEYIFDQKKSEEKITMKSDVEITLESQYNPWRHLEFKSVFDFLNSTDQKVQNLVVMNLSGQGIRTIDLNFNTPQPNLRELDLSYNKLTALPDLKVLRYMRKLDISFNDIRSFEISTSLPMLESLDAAWNRIFRFVSTLRALETFSPNLTALNLKNNPFTDVTEMETMFALVRNALPLLRCFNEQIIDDFSLLKNGDPIHWIIDGFEKSDPAKLNIINNAMLRRRIISHINVSLTPSFSVDKNKSKNVQYINLSDNKLSCLQFIDKYPNLRELYLENNLFMKIMLRKPLNRLTRLNLCSNLIVTVDGITQENLPLLNYLDLSNNLITSLVDLGTFHSLIEFYCSHNEIDRLSEVYNLKNWQNLKIVDLSNNPIDSTNACRTFIVFNLPKIEYVGNHRVTPSDILEANHALGATLDKDTIMNMRNGEDFSHLKQLSIVNCGIKKVNLAVDQLPNLESLNLCQNRIKTLWGLHNLRKLQTLCLSQNQVETSLPIHQEYSNPNELCLFPNLNTLFLDRNGVKSLININFQNMPSLKYLYMQHNRLQDVNGLQNCPNLKILILDHNKINIIPETVFHVANNIIALFLENNRIKFLSFTKRLSKIEKLFISNNKLADKGQLKYIGTLEHLKELTMLGNPLCKNSNHYKIAMEALPTLKRIDGCSVILDEYLTDH